MSHYYRTASTTFSSRSERMWRRNQNTVAFAPAVSLGPISHTIIVALMVAVLGIMYLTQVTRTGAYSYDIDGLDKKLTQLKQDKSDLTNENARLQALSTVANSTVAKAMEKPQTTEYTQN